MAELTLQEFGLKYGYNEGEDGWKNGMDQNLIKLNIGAVGFAVENDALLAEPGSPVVGDAYILPTGVKTGTNWGTDTGAVTNAIAIYTNITTTGFQTDDSPWTYLTPQEGWYAFDRTSDELVFFDGTNWVTAEVVSFQLAASDLTTALVAGTNVAYFRAPFQFRLTAVRASLLTSGTGLTTVDINVGGATVLSTKLTIDSTENTSETAATPPVISGDGVIDDDELVAIDIDAVGTGAAGLIVTLIGARIR